MTIREGQAVSYIGDGTRGVPLGAHGRLLAYATVRSAHVQWLDGPLRGQVTVHDVDEELAPAPQRFQAALQRDGLEDSLEVGPISATGTRHTFDVEGPAGVLTMMASAGRLSNFDTIADDVLLHTEGLIRQEASVREVLADLDDAEGDELVSLASRVLLRDAFGAVEDEDA